MYVCMYVRMYVCVFLCIHPSINQAINIYLSSIYLSLYLSIYLSTHPLSTYLPTYLSTILYTMYLCSYKLAWLCAGHLYKYKPITMYYNNYHITLKKWPKMNLFFKFYYISKVFFLNKGSGNITFRGYWNYRPTLRCTMQSITTTASDV